MGGYQGLKILNSMLYNMSLCLTIGYIATMKFSSQATLYMFTGFLIARPALILIYSCTMAYIESNHKKAAKKGAKKKDQDSESEISEMSGSNDFMNNSYMS